MEKILKDEGKRRIAMKIHIALMVVVLSVITLALVVVSVASYLAVFAGVVILMLKPIGLYEGFSWGFAVFMIVQRPLFVFMTKYIELKADNMEKGRLGLS